MTPELVTYILTVSLGIVVGLALSATRQSVYTRWLERKLATTRIELAKLKDTRQQPWLQGATKEYHLQKKIEGFRETLKKASRFNELSKIESAPAWDSDSPFQKKIDTLLADTKDEPCEKS